MTLRRSTDDDPGSRNRLTPADALVRTRRYCAYQERSHQEVKSKLFSFGLYGSEVDEILVRLISDGFLNEQRFAKAFAGGKFRIKKWGRLKILRELEQQGLTENCIRDGMKEIDPADYLTALRQVLDKKVALIAATDIFRKRDKLARYAIARGFEPDLVWEQVKQMLPTHR